MAAIKEAVDIAGNAVWHGITRTVSVVCTLAVIAGLFWAVYVTLIKPHTNPTTTQTQQAEEISNTYITNTDDAFFLGLRLFGFKIGITKPVKQTLPVVKQEK